MSALVLKSLIFISLISAVFSQIPISGSCPSFDCCKEEFEPLPVEEMNGVWYYYGGVPFFFDSGTKCTRVNVTSLTSDYFHMAVTQKEISLDQIRNSNGFGNFTTDGKVTTLISNFQFPIRYEIIQLSPDFIILFACSECGFFSKEGAGLYVYIYTRLELPPFPIVEAINEKLQKCDVPLDMIVKHDQITCSVIVGGGC